MGARFYPVQKVFSGPAGYRVRVDGSEAALNAAGTEMKDLDAVATAMREAMDETMHAETVGGNEADDEPQDALAAEYEEKNGSAGGE